MIDDTVTAAFELVRKHGFVEALEKAKIWRDANSPGTMSYALHNQMVKQLEEFATVGAIYRKVGRS